MIPVKVLSVRYLASASDSLCQALGAPKGYPCLAMLTTDSDDATYIALDEATKAADVKVCYGRSFYAGTDRRHNFTIVAMHKFSDKFDLSLSWTYQSGRRGNVPTYAYIAGLEGETSAYHLPQFSEEDNIYKNQECDHTSIGDNVYDGQLGGFAPLESYKERNEQKLPDTHRLDLSANYHIKHHIFNRKVESIVNVSVYNLYNRFNINNIYWQQTDALEYCILFWTILI